MAGSIYAAAARRLATVSGLALTVATSGAAAQSALPTGGSVASGAASIGRAGSSMTVTQSSQRAIVNWGDFSIGQGASVNFAQPNSNSAILNRVTGSTTSQIAGQLNANGQVYLVNPNGIAITRTGAVQVGGGFVASTLGLSNDDFTNGNFNFKGNGASKGVSVDGSITTAPGGFVGLIGGTVSVSGEIVAPLGKVALGSGEAATLDLTGDNFLRVAVPTGATTADGQGLVDVSGKVRAAGGAVIVKAATAANAVRNAINIPGSLSATSAYASGGSIILGGGPGGDVNASGQIAASGAGRGGSVTIAGRNVKLNQAKIAANGKTGPGGSITITADKTVSLASTLVSADGGTRGGAIRVGGDFHGASDIPAAQQVTVDAASVLSANAGAWGDGGTVAVWSNAATGFAGLINARGGSSGGNGGYVEVSANPANHGLLAYSGLADTRAPAGVTGTLLLDPYDITISTGATDNITPSGGTTYTSSGTPSVLNTTTLDNQLATSNVTVSTGVVGSVGGEAGNITVTDDVAWTPSTTATTLTLQAAGYIHLDANITANAGSLGQGSLTMTATNEIYQRSDVTITANNLSATSSAGPVVLSAFNSITGSVSGSGPTGFSFANIGDVNVGAGGISAPNGSVALVAYAGSVLQTGPITGLALYADSINGNVDLLNHANSVGTVAGAVSASGTGEFVYNGTNASTTIGTVNYNISQATVDTIGSATSTPGITANSVFVTNYGGDLVVDAAVTSANGVGLGATGAFINNVGAGAITIGNSSEWQVFSSSPAVDKFNGLDSANYAVWNSPIGSGGETSGNRYFFAFQPTITITSTNVAKIYGDDVTTGVAAAYTITGLQPAVAGAYLGDTAAIVYSGTPHVTSLGSPPTASVAGSPYAITVANGTMQVTDGYALALVSSGQLTVSPASLTWSVDDANSTYGTTAVLGAATLFGVVNGDTVTPTVGAFSGANQVVLGPRTPAGTYSEQVTAIDNSNYTLGLEGNTPGALVISPLAIAYSVANANSTYGTTAIPGAATLYGVVPGDTLTPTVGVFSGATPVTLAPKTPVGSYSEQVTSLNNPNYTIAVSDSTPGVLKISPLAITWAVANANSTYGTTAVLGATTLNGVLAGDTVTPTTGAFSGATPVTLAAKTPVGGYSEQVTAITNPNYTLAANGNTPGLLTISPLAITYAVANANSTYGTTAVLGATTLNGVLRGDTVTPTTGAFSGATSITLAPKTPAGSYSERVYALSNPNYTVAANGNTPGVLTVSPLAITYAVADAYSTYGTTPVLGATTLNGVLAGDTVTPTTEAFSGATPIALSPRTPVGSYSEEVTALSNANYTLAATGNTPGVLTVSPLAITYAVANANSLYGTTPVLGAATLNGVVAGDTVTPTVGAFSGAQQVALTPSLPTGVYAERVTALSNGNYTIAATGNSPGDLTVSLYANTGLPPALINWAPSTAGGGIDLGYFENQLSATQNSCNFGADLPDPNRFSDPKAALQALSTSMEKMFELCQNMTPSTIADALDAYADRLEVLAPRLPPQLRTLPQIIRKAAQNIRNAKTPGEAVKAVGAAIAEVHKAIALLRAENPDVARAGAEESKSVDSALNAARISLLRASAI